MKFFRSAAAFLISVTVMLSSVAAFGAEEKKLYEIYEFNEAFEYDPVIMGSALKTAVVKIENNVPFKVEYNPVVFEKNVFLNDYTMLVQNNPNVTVDDIINYMKENISDYLYYQNETKVIEDYITGTGSGVVISEDGYIATNTHVIETNEDEMMDFIVSNYILNSIVDDLKNIVDSAGEWGIAFSEEDKDALIELIVTATEEKLDITLGEAELTALMPTSSGETSYDATQIYEAEVVEKGTSGGTEGITHDGAILKIDEINLVALKLSEDYPKAATEIMSCGFPFDADSIFLSAGSGKSYVNARVSEGIVDSVIDYDEYKAIGITSRISGGSSGGPSIDNQLNIEGLNTYTSSNDERFAYMVPAELIRDQAGGKNITLISDEVTKTFLLGLQMLQQGYGITANECFARVQQLQPKTPYIETLIAEAQAAPQEEAPKLRGEGISPVVWIVLGVVLAVIIFVLIILLIVISMSKKKKNTYYREIPYSSAGSGSSDDSLF